MTTLSLDDMRAVASRMLETNDLSPADALIVQVIAQTGVGDRVLAQWLTSRAVKVYARRKAPALGA